VTGEGPCAVLSSAIPVNLMLEVVDQNSAASENHRSFEEISARTFCLYSRPASCQISKQQPESLPRCPERRNGCAPCDEVERSGEFELSPINALITRRFYASQGWMPGRAGQTHNATKRNMIAWQRCVSTLGPQIPSTVMSAQAMPRFIS
jgi:hypothetical protein